MKRVSWLGWAASWLRNRFHGLDGRHRGFEIDFMVWMGGIVTSKSISWFRCAAPYRNSGDSTLEELLRIKAFLAYDRDFTRDFVDFAELSRLLEPQSVIDALCVLDEKFRWEKQPSIIVEVTKSLIAPAPHDLQTNSFETLRLLRPN